MKYLYIQVIKFDSEYDNNTTIRNLSYCMKYLVTPKKHKNINILRKKLHDYAPTA
jgi:hypothetical protein